MPEPDYPELDTEEPSAAQKGKGPTYMPGAFEESTGGEAPPNVGPSSRPQAEIEPDFGHFTTDPDDPHGWIPEGNEIPFDYDHFKAQLYADQEFAFAKLTNLMRAYIKERDEGQQLEADHAKLRIEFGMEKMKTMRRNLADKRARLPVDITESTELPQLETPRQRLSPKIPDPKALSDGQDPTYDFWRAAVMRKLKVNADHYPSEDAKVAFVIGVVSGDAANHIEPLIGNEDLMLTELMHHLDAIFINPHKQKNARQEYRSLKMGNDGDFHQFVTKFRITATQAAIPADIWDEDFYAKLPAYIQRGYAARQGLHDGFDDLVSGLGAYISTIKAIEKDHPRQSNTGATRARGRGNWTGGAGRGAPPTFAVGRGTPVATGKESTPAPEAGAGRGRQTTAPPGDIACYGCGKAGVIRARCPTCSGNRNSAPVQALDERQDDNQPENE
jgi:hypothetical protein